MAREKKVGEVTKKVSRKSPCCVWLAMTEDVMNMQRHAHGEGHAPGSGCSGCSATEAPAPLRSAPAQPFPAVISPRIAFFPDNFSCFFSQFFPRAPPLSSAAPPHDDRAPRPRGGAIVRPKDQKLIV